LSVRRMVKPPSAENFLNTSSGIFFFELFMSCRYRWQHLAYE
jgi:hypothetical protein